MEAHLLSSIFLQQHATIMSRDCASSVVFQRVHQRIGRFKAHVLSCDGSQPYIELLRLRCNIAIGIKHKGMKRALDVNGRLLVLALLLVCSCEQSFQWLRSCVFQMRLGVWMDNRHIEQVTSGIWCDPVDVWLQHLVRSIKRQHLASR